MIDKSICDKRFIKNPSNCECECDQSRDAGENLENCKYRKRLIVKLVEERSGNIHENKMANITLNKYKIVYFK